MANKYQTLRRSSDFQNLKENGRRIRISRWLILSYLRTHNQELQCGWTLSRKVASSVLRNRLKRWCREFFRGEAERLGGYQINVVFLPQPEGFFKKLTHQEFIQQLQRACSKLQ